MECKSLLWLLGMFPSFVRVESNLGGVFASASPHITSKFFLEPSPPLPITPLLPALRF